MKKSYREILRRTSQHGESEHAGTLGRLARVIAIPLVTLIWLACTSVYVISLIASIGSSAAGSRETGWISDAFILALTAGILVMFSGVSRDVIDTAKWIWTQFEDSLGRFIVFGHAASHTFIPESKRFLRKILAWVLALLVLSFTFFCLRTTLHFVPDLSVGPDSFTTMARLAGHPTALLFVLGCLSTSALGILIWRFFFSKKWLAVYSLPKCADLHIEEKNSRNKSADLKILHASDFHITGKDDELLIEGSRTLPLATIDAVLKAVAEDAEDCDAVLLTGDITDAGSALAWERFLNQCPESIRKKIVLIPGNHDLNLQDPTGIKKAERFDSLGRRMRQIRALCAMTELMGDRAYIMDRQTGRRLTLAQYFERNRTSIEARAQGAEKSRRTIGEIWNGLFPMVVPIQGTNLGIVILDSVKPASIGLTNAFGAVPFEVIQACTSMMAAMTDKCDSFAFALHHHIAVPFGGSLYSRFQNAGLVFENAADLINMLVKRGDPAVVFHGHRHVAYTGMVENTDVSVVASPSATIGAGGTPLGGSWRIVDLSAASGECRLAHAPEYRSLARRGAGVRSSAP